MRNGENLKQLYVHDSKGQIYPNKFQFWESWRDKRIVVTFGYGTSLLDLKKLEQIFHMRGEIRRTEESENRNGCEILWYGNRVPKKKSFGRFVAC